MLPIRFDEEYDIWHGMFTRCYNPNATNYKLYGDRGIKICERWFTYSNFIADMGRRPSSKHEIGRIDNNKGYEPSNCRWETKAQQAHNRRSNVLTFDQVLEIRQTYELWNYTMRDLATMFNVSCAQISRVINMQQWKEQ